jgi:hypothetical protein
MNREQEQIKICGYLLRRLENELAEQEERELKEYLRNQPDGIELYMAVADVYAQFSIPNKLDLEFEPSEQDVPLAYMDFLKALGHDEKQAQALVPRDENQPRPLIEHVLYPPKAKRRLSKFSLVSLIISSAAILLVVLFARFAPPRSHVEVATLTDSFHAVWADRDPSTQKGKRLVAGTTSYLLKEGFAELLFDNNVRVTLEGPAAFQVLAQDQIKLTCGRLYATVPQEAIGFTVNTLSARIIDLGTEFGIEAELGGDTALHVIKGKTVMIAGDQSGKASVEVGQGAAKKVSFNKQTVSDIACNDLLFARNIDSAGRLVWRGKTEIDLADIVGGGNGFESGTRTAGIEVTTGRKAADLSDIILLPGSPGFKPVDSSPYIDGVFSPGIEDGPTQVASDESITAQLPRTSGNYWGYIFNGAFHRGVDVPQHALKLDGMVFGGPDTPAITIHPNQGITFDLAEIRKNLPTGKIVRFRSLIGISETVPEHITNSSAVFWVFVDGRKVCEQVKSTSNGAGRLDIPLTDQDRFLTLAVTESNDYLGYDWTLFGRPELVIDPVK